MTITIEGRRQTGMQRGWPKRPLMAASVEARLLAKIEDLRRCLSGCRALLSTQPLSEWRTAEVVEVFLPNLQELLAEIFEGRS